MKEIKDYLRLVDWFVNGDVGTSSKNIVIHMLNLEGSGIFPPFDKWDRLRCIKLLKLFPEWYERLGEMTDYQGWDTQIDLIKEEFNQN